MCEKLRAPRSLAPHSEKDTHHAHQTCPLRKAWHAKSVRVRHMSLPAPPPGETSKSHMFCTCPTSGCHERSTRESASKPQSKRRGVLACRCTLYSSSRFGAPPISGGRRLRTPPQHLPCSAGAERPAVNELHCSGEPVICYWDCDWLPLPTVVGRSMCQAHPRSANNLVCENLHAPRSPTHVAVATGSSLSSKVFLV